VYISATAYALAKIPSIVYSPTLFRRRAFIRQTTLSTQFGISGGIIAKYMRYADRKSRIGLEF